MGINTNLNISPYFDDYDPQKQYVRVLFKPARALQARELTQLQTMLQTQIERFGSNIYQEGTIIEGVNPSTRDDLNYIKVNDQVDFDDLTIYNPVDVDTKFYLRGASSGLFAEIIAGANGFQTRDPDLKTFFIRYLVSAQPNINNPEIKQFIQGELLTIEDQNGNDVLTITAASVDNHAGNSYAVDVTDGVIYQRGHFNFVQPQLLIVSKYDNNPDGISVGFNITENIVDTAIDTSLLDNAQGFNNLNAPGADRLQLTPTLQAYTTATRPINFFTLIRLELGKPIYIRSETQFNSIGRELAKRTFEESGSYVVDGLNVTVEEDGADLFAVVGPGKAYAFGYEVNNLNNQRIKINPATLQGERTNQTTGVIYGSFLEFDMADRAGSVPAILENHNFTDRYILYGINTNSPTAKGPRIGTCSIRSIEPGPDTGRGKIYVYAVEKEAPYQTARIGWIGETPVLNGQIINANLGAAIFDTGRTGMISAEGITITRKFRNLIGQGGLTVNANNQVIISTTTNGDQTITPIGGNIFGVDNVNQVVNVTDTAPQYNQGNDVTSGVAQIVVTFDAANAQDLAYVYYDAAVNNVPTDTLQQVSVFVNSTFVLNQNRANLGIPNVVKINSIVDNDTGVDLTSKFRLVNNQKDGYYGLSFLTLKSGETVTAEGVNSVSIKVNMIALKRSFTGLSGILAANSYANVDLKLVKPFTAKNGQNYKITNCYDFRPYQRPAVSYTTSSSNPVDVPTDLTSPSIEPPIPLSNNSAITANLKYYLPRYDKFAIDDGANFTIMQGQPSDNPSKLTNSSIFGLADIYVPGDDLSKNGVNAVKVTTNTVKNYTMEDIRGIERRVDTVVDILALSLLENQTKDLFIPDANGINRFKNGIIVDQFKDLYIADLLDDEYRASIERGAAILTPLVTQFPVDLKVEGGSNITTFDNMTTIQTSQQGTLIEQEYATNFRNLVSNYYEYKGNVLLNPMFDSEYDVTEDPAVTLDIDLASPLLDLVDNIQRFVPLTNTTRTNTEAIGPTRTEGGFRVTPMRDTFRTDFLTSDVYNIQQEIGTFVTDFSITPFMNARNIQIAVSGLRPDTTHYFFFDGVDVNAHVFPGAVASDLGRSVKASDVFRNGTKGAAVKTDSFGKLYAVFSLPPATFFVGEAEIQIADVDQFTSIESGSTSVATQKYRAYSFAVNKQGVSADVRTADFDIDSRTFTENRDRRVQIPRRDPLAQTFIVRSGQDEEASFVFCRELDIFLKRKSKASARNGLTVQIRETTNGYPSAKVLPFASKHLDWDDIVVSDDSSGVTKVTFDDPIKLKVGTEYAIILMPDANDPDYLAFTAVVGEPELRNEDFNVASDWGDGMLFSSTNNSAWKPYDNEDLKFKIYKLIFSTDESYVDLVANDMEFINVSNPTGNFLKDEYVYVFQNNEVYSATLTSAGALTVAAGSSFSIVAGDIIHVNQANLNQFAVGRVKTLNENNGLWSIVMDEPPPLTEGQCTITLCIGGKVSFWDARNNGRLHLKQSSVRGSAPDNIPVLTYTLAGDEVIRGADSGAYATITGLFNAPVSYFQPFIMQTNTIRTRTDMQLFKDSATYADAFDVAGQGIPFFDNAYMTSEPRFIPSKQNLIEAVSGEAPPDRFRFRISLTNQNFRLVTPTIDNALSILQAYEYDIDLSQDTSSKYISKEVVLQPDMLAQGLKVILAAYRPAGTVIDVYSRFVYPTNIEQFSDWVELENDSPDLYSTTSNVNDYREFTYNLTNEFSTDLDEQGNPIPNEFVSFQLKIVMRHATDIELNNFDLFNINRGKNLFCHVYDYRAIALT